MMKKIWLILDKSGVGVSIAPTEVDARRQVRWILPRPCDQYVIKEWIVPNWLLSKYGSK